MQIFLLRAQHVPALHGGPQLVHTLGRFLAQNLPEAQISWQVPLTTTLTASETSFLVDQSFLLGILH